MAPIPYFNSVTSESVFKSHFRSECGRNFSELDNMPASYWGRPHLLACRVVRREPQKNILPLLSSYTSPSDLQASSDEIKSFLKGPETPLMSQSEHYTVRTSNCVTLAQTWAALAIFKGHQDRRTHGISINKMQAEEKEDEKADDDFLNQSLPKRPRKATSQPGFIDSRDIQVGSSSPLYDGSFADSHGSSVGYVDREAHFLGITPEDDTLRLASCVIRHILYYSPPQSSIFEPKVVEYRDAKTRIAATTAVGERQIVAIDDGGLCLRQQKPGGSFILAKNHVAILEAKPQFQHIEHGQPVISDKCFAQMVCEALAARLSDLDNESNRSTVVINATQNYLCFLQFDMSDEYILDFESASPTHCLYVTSTPWFDISQKIGRENILANLCGIMRRATVD